jgi:hypothetical protein
MYPPDEFLKHADDCQRMAKAARHPATKATWRQMSQRWVQCAERAKDEDAIANNAVWSRRHRMNRPTRLASAD